ncbi:MAG: hypothetical protein J6T57_02570 [Alphaproteobacteria bacterium]|nr:hypothetical protein [Alphaproteobacteria bacterium]
MGYIKYCLYETGLFPRLEPQISDVLDAALWVDWVKEDMTSHGRSYYYVMPTKSTIRSYVNIAWVFRENGVLLRLYRSKQYGGVVFRVPNRGQDFIKNVKAVNENVDVFQTQILPKYMITRER